MKPVKPTYSTRGPASKSVLVTGVSSGIGRATAVRLASRGRLVFGTVRKEEDAAAIAALGLPDLVPLRFDLNRREELPGLLRSVEAELERRGHPGLFALVNNAGGSLVGPIELMDLESFRLELEARLLGSLALVQAFLPSLRRAGGRILWISTPGIIPTPYVTGIHACDFAVNCIARTLAIELGREGPKVILIRCGGIRTGAGLGTMRSLEAGLETVAPERRAVYEERLARWGRSMAEFDAGRSEPERVAETVERALGEARPRSRYRVGHMSAAASFLEALPQTLVDRILALNMR
ncbi:MAG: SDR family NAD(P)-dependent oxidoreductase [Rectinemataceae bacterium]